jgi:photosystem II stability/assembly factor-like uncharacterized protein
MKVIIFLFLLPTVLLAQQTHPDSLWHTTPTSPHQPNGARFEDLYTFDDKSGYGIDYSGHLYGFNKDSNWTLIISDSSGARYNDTRSVAFLTKDQGWIGLLNNKVPLLKTNDGGKSWQVVPMPSPSPMGICGLSLVNDTLLFGAGAFDVGLFGDSNAKTVVIKTIDGGATFTCIDMSPYASSLVDCRFTDRNNGLVTGTAGGKNYHEGNAVVLKTTDGGNSWKSVYRSERIGEQGWKIFFRTPTKGYVALQSPSKVGITYNMYILKTTDGGETWKEIVIGHGTRNVSPQGVCFADAMNGIVGGYSDSVFTTTDGGESWEQFSTQKIRGINRSRRINDTASYVIASQVLAFGKNAASTVARIDKAKTTPPYPNPAKEFVKIELQPEGRCIIDIIDSKGVTISTLHGDRFAYIPTSSLAAGSYSARIRSGKSTTYSRFVVTH